MSVGFKRISALLICVLFIVAIFSLGNRGKYAKQKAKSQSIHTELVHKLNHSHNQNHQKVVTKVVPSAYKHMLSDGKNVSSAVSTIMKMTNGGKHKNINKNSLNYRKAKSAIDLNVSQGQTNWDVYSSWSPFANDKVKLLPGASTANGDYDCVFVFTNSKGRIDGFTLARYRNDVRKFVDIDNFGTRQVPSKKRLTKKQKSQKQTQMKNKIKKHLKAGRVTKKNTKRAVKASKNPNK